jgi:Holliday junction DNA helicase RuvA
VIGSLNGTVIARRPDGCLLEVSGVGYQIACSATTMSTVPPVGSEVRLFTHLHVREDALALYGFAIEGERLMFEALIGVSGVGPKVALQVCSSFTPEAFRKALVTDDVDAICAIPGIGKKTAARMVLDLKEKLDLPDLALVGSKSGDKLIAQARSALENLGYSSGEVRVALGEISPEEDASIEELIRTALKVLAS